MTRPALPKLEAFEQEPGFRYADSKADRARAMLEEQKAAIETVLANPADSCMKASSESLLRHIKWWLGRDDAAVGMALGFMGPNGRGPEIEQLIRSNAKLHEIDARYFAEAAE